MQLIGTIHGEVRAGEFEILLSEKDVERGSYIRINHHTYGWVLGRIDSTRRYVDKGDEITMAKAHVIGFKKGSAIMVPKTPFNPRERVYVADRALILDVLGLRRNKDGSIYIGLLESVQLPVYLDVKKTIGKHMSILAKTGAGKSYTMGVILEELLKNRVPAVIIDPHGEYSSLKYENDDYGAMVKYNVKPRSYDKQLIIYAADILVRPNTKKLSLKPKFTLSELIRVMPIKLNDRQKAILYEAMERLEGKDYALQDIINSVKLDRSKTKWSVISGLNSLKKTGIFEGHPLSEKDLVREGHASILDLKGAEPRIQELIVAKIARDLFEAKKQNKIPDFVFLIEESHNFCPERAFGDALSSQILRTIASEGRKFGFHLCVISQRPARVDKNVLSQCNTQIILKVTNQNDLKAISQSIEGMNAGIENDVQQLPIGHALIVGECVEQPITVEIRVRETKHGSQGKTVVSKSESGAKSRISKALEKVEPVFLKEENEPLVEPQKKSMFGKLKNIFIREE